MSEAKIQTNIVKYLQSKKIFFCSIPNEAAGAGRDAQIRMSKLKSMGLRSGAPDLILFLNDGLLISLEVKAETGKQSKPQVLFEEKIKILGFNYFIVKSVDDVRGVLNEFRF